MASIDSYLDDLLARGRAYFSRGEAAAALGLKPSALAAAITRAINKRRLANPRHGFYLILRPEDQVVGAPDPVKWIDPLMKHQGIDYRISLLRAAAFHGASHQASMVFQVVVPRQLRDFDLGRHRLQFLYQAPTIFSQVNQPALVGQMKSEAGFATVAGIELTLLDCVRYFHKAAGINGVAQIVKDIGAKASQRLLQKAAGAYENSAVRRLGYLLDLAGHARQADALQGSVKRARTALPLDPAVRPLVKAFAGAGERNPRWRLLINEAVENCAGRRVLTAESRLHCLRGRRDGQTSCKNVDQDNGSACSMRATPGVLDDPQARASMTLAAVVGVDRSRSIAKAGHRGRGRADCSRRMSIDGDGRAGSRRE